MCILACVLIYLSIYIFFATHLFYLQICIYQNMYYAYCLPCRAMEHVAKDLAPSFMNSVRIIVTSFINAVYTRKYP